jgi:hypothetical protein
LDGRLSGPQNRPERCGGETVSGLKINKTETVLPDVPLYTGFITVYLLRQL